MPSFPPAPRSSTSWEVRRSRPRRRPVVRATLLLLVLAAAQLTGAGPARASASCDALNAPAGDGFYFKGRFTASFFQAGDVITIRADFPIGTAPKPFVPTGFYLGIGAFDAPPVVPVVRFPGTLVYTFPKDVSSVHLNWATTPSIPDGYEVSVTWQVSCQNAPKATPTLSTQASPSVLLGGPVHDTATLSGGDALTGTLTFRLYGPDDANCSGAVAFTTSTGVSGNGTYQSASFTPSAAGTYRWRAEYSGDAKNHAVSAPCNAPNESVVVRPFQPPPPTSTLRGDVTGPVTVASGQSVVVNGGRVIGPIRVQAGGALHLVDSRVTNGIVADNPSFLSICNSSVSAPSGNPSQGIVVTNAGVPVRIGDPASSCAGNWVAGDVRLTGNTAGLTLGGNTVSGNVTVDNNTVGMIVVKGNAVSTTLACSGNNPAPVHSGQPNSAATKTGQCSGL